LLKKTGTFALFFPVFFLAGSWAQSAGVDLSSARIMAGYKASSQERFAVLELQRYLYRLSGKMPVITSRPVESGTSIALGTPGSNPFVARLAKHLSLTKEAVGDEGYHLKVLSQGRQHLLVIAALKPVGVLYGVYDLLERLGIGFYLGGDTFPPKGLPVRVPADLDQVCKPVFGIRGSLPWYNFLDSPTTWDLQDYKHFFEQMAKQRFNFVGFHTYDSEPFVPYEWQGQLVYAGPLASSLTYGWGTVRGLKTADFGFGTGEYFDRDPFASRSLLEATDPRAQILSSCKLLGEALNFARGLGIKVCLGFELTGDPTDPETVARLEARLQSLIRMYPMLDYVWFWQSEGLGGGSELPDESSPLGMLARKEGKYFAYLGDPRRIAEAVRISHYANIAYRILKRLTPGKGVIVSGWGGDRWMRFSDFYEGLDRTLPKDIVFAALDNIDPTAEPNVSAVYGKLSPERQRWPIPWWESDGGGTRRDQWAPQCNTKPFVDLCRDALKKKCQGMLAIHWRTRDVEEVAGYQARFAWNPSLGYQQYYDDLALKCYGERWAKTMSEAHRQLESLGSRWTGALGQTECGAFGWLDENRLPSPDNLRILNQVREKVAKVREEMKSLSGGGLERVNWLLTTLDWLLGYDAAAVRLRPDGDIARQVVEAEQAKAAGDTAAPEKARQAYDALLSSGLREALQTYPRKMSTMGEWGTLATINVKAYAAFLQLVERVRKVNPGLPEMQPEIPVSVDEHPFIVMRNPSTTAQPGKPLPVEAVVMSGKPVRSVMLYYRKQGSAGWTALPMKAIFRRTYSASIPASSVTQQGLEFFLKAEDNAGRKAFAPAGYPAATWSVTGMIPTVPLSPAGPPAGQKPVAPATFKAEITSDYEVTLTWDEPPENRGLRYKIFRGDKPDFIPSDVTLLTTTYFPPIYDLTDRGDATFYYAVAPVPPTGQHVPVARTMVAVPRPPVPPPPAGLTAVPGPGTVRLSWKPPDRPNLRFNIYRAEGESGDFQLMAKAQPLSSFFIDTGLASDRAYRYHITSVDRGGQESLPGEVVSAQPLPVIREPVFSARFDGDAVASVASGIDPGVGKGTLHPPSGFTEGVQDKALDIRSGGYVTYPYDPAFDLSRELSITCWVKPETLEGMPVIASCGEWGRNGWFLQIIGGGIRFYIGGGNVLDAGRSQAGQWIHIAAVFDGRRMILYQDGRQVGSKKVLAVDYTPWGRPLFVGQYHFLQEPYQVHGLIDELKIYQRAIPAEEVAKEYAKEKPVQ